MVEIIKTMRVMKLLMNAQTSKSQRELVKFFDYYTVKSGDESELPDEQELGASYDLANADEEEAAKKMSFWDHLLKDFDPDNSALDKEIAVRLGVDKEHVERARLSMQAHRAAKGGEDMLAATNKLNTGTKVNRRMQSTGANMDLFLSKNISNYDKSFASHNRPVSNYSNAISDTVVE